MAVNCPTAEAMRRREMGACAPPPMPRGDGQLQRVVRPTARRPVDHRAELVLEQRVRVDYRLDLRRLVVVALPIRIRRLRRSAPPPRG
eukprot:gene674-biopygen6044